MNSNYALHEMLEVHEIAAFKTVCMTKSKTMQALVTDPELMQILQQDVQLSQQQLQELSGVLSKVTL
ncbi:Spore coat protein F precursor [compost metagenome]